MSKKFRAILILTVLFLVVTLILYFLFRQEINNRIFSKNIYVLYEPNKDQFLNWRKNQDFFPTGFNPGRAMYEVEEILALNQEQKKLYDSLINNYFKTPRIRQRNSQFFIPISPYASVLLEIKGKKKEVDLKEVEDLNIISLDSLIKVTPGLEYHQLKNSRKLKTRQNVNFHLVIPDSSSNEAEILPFKPLLEEYD